MKKKSVLIVAIILMAVGFATLATNLIINGNVEIGNKAEDYEIIFTSSILEGVENNNLIIDNGKKIRYETRVLMNVGDTSELIYEISNNSREYDGEVSINCTPKGTTTHTDLYSIDTTNTPDVIKAKTSEVGSIKITLNQTTTEEIREEFECELNINALERTTPGKICNYESGKEWNFDYTGSDQEFIIPCDGKYKLEVWGAQGGSYGNYEGGYGAYANGQVTLTKETPIYLYIGGSGNGNGQHVYQPGGFNGGGDATPDNDSHTRQASGGGATHISLKQDLLKDLEAYKSDILIVAAGGGGSGANSVTRSSYGGSGGGIKGNDGDSHVTYGSQPYGGNQTTPGDVVSCQNVDYCGTGGFGVGGSSVYAGGGAGLYGGGAGGSYSAAGGSSYIGNPLLTEKVMVCYECETSDEEETKTISVTEVSEEPIANYAKKRNGYAKITYLG